MKKNKKSKKEKRQKEKKKTLKVKKILTSVLNLTAEELIHIRDLFSITCPPEMTITISQSLSKLESREMMEANLWKKIGELCTNSNLPTEEQAPNYVIAPCSLPELRVFPLDKEDSVEEEEFEIQEDDDSEGSIKKESDKTNETA